MSFHPNTRLWIPGVVLVVTAAVYLPTLTYGFVFDDTEQIVWSQPHLTWRAVPSYFTSDVWSYNAPGQRRSYYYRPIFLLWLMINSRVIGVNTVLWHLSALLTHLAATFLFYLLARRLIGDPLIAGVAALLFGVHPAHVEAVAWVSGATEPLFAIAAFGTLLCHMRSHKAGLVLFAVALLTKETAVILPVLIFAYEWLFQTAPAATPRQRLWHAASAVAPYAGLLALYLPLRAFALGSLGIASGLWRLGVMAATLPISLAFYLRQLLLPVQYSMFYPIEPVRDSGLTNFYLPLLAVAIAAAVLVWLSRRSKVIAFSSVLLVAPILPVLNLRPFALQDFLHDRYLYLAVAGLSILLALGIRRIGRERTPVVMGITLGLTLVLSVITLRTCAYWPNDVALFTRSIEVAPENPVAQAHLGHALVHEKRWTDALPLLKASLVGEPLEFSAYNDIAECYEALGDYNQATGYLRDIVVMAPRYSASYLNLGMLEMHQGRLDDAEAHIRRALALRKRTDNSPAFDRYHFALGLVLEARGDLKGALAEYQAELRENPGTEDVSDRMLDLQSRLRAHAQ